jgi:hypothetical protein
MLLFSQKIQPQSEPATAFATREVFIGGAPRSGTTLLLALLDSHPEMLVFPKEVALFNRGVWKTGDQDVERLAHHLLTHTEIAELDPARSPSMGPGQLLTTARLNGFPYAAFEKNFLHRTKQRPTGGPRHVLHSLFRAYAETRPTAHATPRIFVEKTPANDYFSADLFKYFPEARLVQIVRDPRAVYASRQRALRQSAGRHTKTFRLVNEWNRSVRQRWMHQDMPEQFLSIRYEDLVMNPRAVLTQVCDFIGIEARPLTLAPTKGGQPWLGNSSYGETFSRISETPLDRWKDELSAAEVAWIEYHCQAGMRDCGYPLLTELSSPRCNFRHWLRPLPSESVLGYVKARRASLCWKLFPNYMMRAH